MGLIRASLSVFLITSVSLQAWAGILKPYKEDDDFFMQKCSSREIKIMSFNTQNLYDTTHDDGYFDYTYLPFSHPDKMAKCETIDSPWYHKLCKELDWTPHRLNKKLAQIGKVVRGHGTIPDILALQEVENENVTRLLADQLGYDYYKVTNQRSKRGQDVALMWSNHKVDFIDSEEIDAPLRNPLRIEFRIKGSKEKLFVYVNHWPAQSAPARWRLESALAVRKDIDRLKSSESRANIVLVGDFNVTFEEEDDVFGDVFLDKKWPNQLIDVHEQSRDWFPQYTQYFPDGTYWNGGDQNSWQRFDRIFVLKDMLNSGVRAEISSYRVLYTEFLTSKKRFPDGKGNDEVEMRFPMSYNFLEAPEYPLGFSDHLPVTMTLSY